MLPTVSIDCPYCGEPIELIVDDSVGNQQYVEDCFVCCRPINVSVSIDDDANIEVVGRADDET
jgi:hypothetical protein